MNSVGFILSVLVALLCFAGNSLLCRFALGRGWIDPASFTFIRIVSGALFLSLFCLLTKRFSTVQSGNWKSAVALVVYALFFSFAYIHMDAGVGALILFAVVQITMIGAGIWENETPATKEWMGLALALSGLALLTLPGKSTPPITGALLMAIAGVGWGFYSLQGRGSKNPLQTTAVNFLWAVPLSIPFLILNRLQTTRLGILCALISGMITSGLGYTLWYTVVPRLGTTKASIVQLAVPVIALILSCLFLHEALSLRAVGAAILIFMGVTQALFSNKPRS